MVGEFYDDKMRALKKYHALNPRPEKVKDEAFTSGAPFYDPRDLVQVKYEMLKRVEEEKSSVTKACRAFGFSRPTFYKTYKEFSNSGIAGLLPKAPGPKSAHKLNDRVMEFVERKIEDEGPLSSSALAQAIEDEFGFSIHPRSVERALDGRQKKRRRKKR